ncbi:response regulator transcription factor [Thalassoroseus pseudoceratinae]|uniref:response regulator transcription factor n=1 Tax=Thalassoroseus pseudoceratinae TaxID=2713176 RepID=UPI0014248A02|nr:response regulator transcription factor [Thalassoroseus pseudoceratinae]
MTTRSSSLDSSQPSVSRVLIVDDHEIVRQGYRQILGNDPSLEICGEAATEMEATQKITQLNPDLVVVDISLRNGHGLEICKQIRAWNEQSDASSPSPMKSLVVSAHDDELYAERALHAGASGYLNKGETGERLVEAIHRVLEGKIFLSPKMTERILNRLIAGQQDEYQSPMDTLTDRELAVFELIGKGLTTKEVASDLELSPKTVESYREKIKEKLNLPNANRLVRAAVQYVLEDA